MGKRIFFIGAIILSIGLNAQQQRIDSSIDAAVVDVYQDPDRALKNSTELLKKVETVPQQIKVYRLRATAYLAKRDFSKALESSLAAEELTTKLQDKVQRAAALNSLAILYQQMDLYAKSLELLNEVDSLLMTAAKHNQDDFEQAKSLAIRGMIYRKQGNIELALEKLLAALHRLNLQQLDEANTANASVICYNIAYCYLELNKVETAIEYFNAALKQAESVGGENLKAYALKGLAEIYGRQERYEKANKLLLKADELSHGIGDIILQEALYRLLSENYLQLDRLALYERYYSLYQQFKAKREKNETESIEAILQLQNNQTSSIIAKAETSYHRQLQWRGLIGFVLLSIVLLFVYRQIIENRKLKRDLEQKLRQ